MQEPDISSMTEAQQRLFIMTRLSDPWWRLNNLYKVENENGELVTFRMRPAQRDLFRNMHKRNEILKARQLGFSTAIDIYLLDQALFNRNIKCGINAQDLKSAGEIFRTKIEIPYMNLPQWLRDHVQLTSFRSSSQGGYMLFNNGSSIQVAVSFRSGTLQRLHISEHGKICARSPQKAKEVRTGTLNAASSKDAIVFIESTAEGVGGDFYDMCMAAIELSRSGQPLTDVDYKFHFFPWFRDPKYSMTVPPRGLHLSKAHADYFTAVEAVAKVTLSDEQKFWYVTTERTQKGEMKQEFPSTPMEAFLTSGRRVFESTDCMTAESSCEPPLIIYDVNPTTGVRVKAQHFREMSDNEQMKSLMNHLLVWELPEDEEEYVIGGDVAEGLESGDRSSFDVIKRSTGEQVAHWFGHLDPELYARLLAHVGTWYNEAYIMPERNNHGHAVLQTLRAVYKHARIYSEQYLDRDTDDETPNLGWLTTAQSKPILVDGAKTLMRNGISGINWIGTVAELNTYVYDARGRANAQEGCFDDQAMSYMLAQECNARAPRITKSEPLKRNKNQHWMSVG
jgi:hypothetical protein